ncbi:hypothetical protein B0H63DRAFT_520533 [Podospora didyma]|uniref:Uncharacterized protein n=1 Tax=Podospora didyma TaxID=330526 RepID=A0AAE0NRM6_9PEZI|nr:hypothetical protein B0H63DRAFT_520533 [Podospora didyma]
MTVTNITGACSAPLTALPPVTRKAALDLYYEKRKVSNPFASKTMIVLLKIADSPGFAAIDYCSQLVSLMDPRYLPKGERQWTCRVWVKEVLASLHENSYIQLPIDLIKMKGARPVVRNDLRWTGLTNMHTTLREIEPYYGPSPMDTETSTSRYYGNKPMDVDTYYYQSSPY